MVIRLSNGGVGWVGVVGVGGGGARLLAGSLLADFII